jgi:hypothetical protein
MSKNRIFSIIYALLGLFVILIPYYIAPMCNNPMMCCRAHTLPLLTLLGVITIVVAAVEFFTDK